MSLEVFFERLLRRTSNLRLAVLLLQSAALFDFAGPWSAIHGFPLDDAWIHQVVARTFARTGTLGYAPGQHGAGATSYLWATILSANYRWFHADPVAFTLAVNVLASLAAGQALLGILLAAQPSDAPRFRWSLQALLTVALATFGGNFLWYAFSGMEAVLVAALSLLGIAFWTRARESRGTTALAAGAFAGLLAVTRPDAAPFGLLLAVSAPLVGRRWRDAVWVLAPWALGLGLYVGSNLLKTGTILPATLSGRKWLWAQGSAGLSGIEVVWDFATVWILRLRNYTLGTSSNEALWIGSGLALHAAVRLVKARRPGPLLVLGWSLAHVATFGAMMPSPGHGGRYQPLVPLVWLWLVGMGSVDFLESLARLVTRLVTRRKGVDAPGWVSALAAVAAVTPWAALVGVGVRDWRHDETMAVSHIRATEIGLGPMVDALPPEARVASFDIGGVGFASSRPILDAGGLTDSRSAGMLEHGRIWQYLRDQHVDYVILPVAYRDEERTPANFGYRLGLFGNPAVILETERALESPPYVWTPSITSTWNASPRQELFRVRYTGVDTTSVYDGRAPHEPFHDDLHLTRWRDRAMLDHDLSLLASVGTPVSLAVSTLAPPHESEDESTWRIALGDWGVSAKAPAGSRVPSDAVRALVAERSKVYIDLGDYGGAALTALRAVAEALAYFDPRPTLATLPPIPEPARGGRSNEVEESLSTVLLLLALFAALGAFLAGDPVGGVQRAASWLRGLRARRSPALQAVADPAAAAPAMALGGDNMEDLGR